MFIPLLEGFDQLMTGVAGGVICLGCLGNGSFLRAAKRRASDHEQDEDDQYGRKNLFRHEVSPLQTIHCSRLSQLFWRH